MKVCLVGAGFIAGYHLDAARAAGGQVSAVCDASPEAARQFAERNGLRAYGDLEEMLEAERPDAVHVLVPPRAHAAVASRVLRRGISSLVEKPLATTVRACDELIALARQSGAQLGVSHNFLFSPPFERLAADLRSGRIGRLDQLDVCWAKPLGGIAGASGEVWPFDRPEHALLEVGVHAFATALAIAGDVADLSVVATDAVTLQNGRDWFRRFELLGLAGRASVHLRVALCEGYPEHWVKLRGNRASAFLDLERGTYGRLEHGTSPLMFDRFAASLRVSGGTASQAASHLGRFLAARLRGRTSGGLFERSVAGAVSAFHAGVAAGALDARISADLGRRAIDLAERAIAASGVAQRPVPAAPRQSPAVAPPPAPDVLVLGATGFIGRALVRALRARGHGVRAVVRNPSRVPAELGALGVDVVAGDLGNVESLVAALSGVRHVVHLARGFGKRWDEIVTHEVEPTLAFARACAGRVETFQYASSIAIYYAGHGAGPIDESTRPRPDLLRANLYARTKWEIEERLRTLQRDAGLPLVVVRPGIVLGRGSSPLHWGVCAWPYPSVARLYGRGDEPLPIVLVADVADAMVRIVATPRAVGESFNLVGPPLLTANEYLDCVEQSASVRFRRVPTQPWQWFAEEAAKYAVKALAGDPERVRPSYADWAGKTFAARFDAAHAGRLLGWSPETQRERVVAEGVVAPAQEQLS